MKTKDKNLLEIEETIEKLYSNNAKELRRLCNKEITQFGGISNMDYDDFYSRVGYDISSAMNSFDCSKGKSFKKYIQGVIKLSVYKEIRYRNRRKRQLVIEIEERDVNGEIKKYKEYRKNISIDTPIGDGEDSSLENILMDKKTVESEFFEETSEAFSSEMQSYLSKLSSLQQKVLHLISIGYTSNEIIGELHINKGTYEDCYNAIHSYRNISILM